MGNGVWWLNEYETLAYGWMKDFGYICVYCNYWSKIQLASTVMAPAWGMMMIRWLGELLHSGWTYAHCKFVFE
jgi:hypothetical protein